MPEFNIPFPGLYESWLSGALDRAEEQQAENMAEDDTESDWPEALRLSASDIGAVLWEHVDYAVAHEYLARAYLDVFDARAGEALGETRPAWRTHYDWKTETLCKRRYTADSCGFKWSIMTSPRYYNFETDRLFATASMAFAKRLWARSRADDHAALRRVIRDRFTSYDGFLSHYSDDLDGWPRKLDKWDHNQMGTLLIACLDLTGFDDVDFMTDVLDGDTDHTALDRGLDWAALDARILDLRLEKLIDWAQCDPEAVARFAGAHPDLWTLLKARDETEVAALDLPLGDLCGAFYRCPETPDMFAA